MFKLVVPASYPKLHLSECLRRLGISLTLRRKIKRSSIIRINDQAAAINAQVGPGDMITIILPSVSKLVAQPSPLSIVYEDDSLLVIDKPAGMLVHPTVKQHDATLANAVLYYYREHNLAYGFHPVQRLDRNTSGLILIAKTAPVQHALRHSNIRRRYLAVVKGCPVPPEGIIDAPIARHPASIIQRVVDKSGQEAITSYRLVTRYHQASIMELELYTGRTHQIRVHMSYIGHPLLGDDLYGGPTELISRQALHSNNLQLTHPVTGQKINLHSPLPKDMFKLLATLSGKNEATAP